MNAPVGQAQSLTSLAANAVPVEVLAAASAPDRGVWRQCVMRRRIACARAYLRLARQPCADGLAATRHAAGLVGDQAADGVELVLGVVDTEAGVGVGDGVDVGVGVGVGVGVALVLALALA